tara:strand:- start:173 stop:706 length:534 start_codon:yes stop_codon:yes gene_type:complete
MSLKKILSTDISTGVQAAQINDVFSADFTLYKIIGVGIVGQTSRDTGTNLRLVKTSDSSIETGSVYGHGLYGLKAEASFTDTNIAPGASFSDRWFNTFAGSDDNGRPGNGVVYVSNPFQASSTKIFWESTEVASDNHRSRWGIGCIQNTTSYDGIVVDLNESEARIGGGKLVVYGVL